MYTGKEGRFFPSWLFLFLMKGADGRNAVLLQFSQEGLFRFYRLQPLTTTLAICLLCVEQAYSNSAYVSNRHA